MHEKLDPVSRFQPQMLTNGLRDRRLTCCSPKLRKAMNVVRVTMLQASPHLSHFKRLLDFGEGQLLVAAATSIGLDYFFVALVIAIGGALGAVRVAHTLGKKITPMAAP